MMKSFSCRPLIFLVWSDTVATPSETDVWMMPLGFGYFSRLPHEDERLCKILETVSPLDSVRLILDDPLRDLWAEARLAPG